MEKLKVVSGKAGSGSLAEALRLAEKTGVLHVPEQALCLHVEGGKVEEARDGK